MSKIISQEEFNSLCEIFDGKQAVKEAKRKDATAKSRRQYPGDKPGHTSKSDRHQPYQQKKSDEGKRSGKSKPSDRHKK